MPMRYRTDPDVRVLELQPDGARFRQDVLEGLKATSKRIPCKFFYDDRGAQLF